ncbi:unnamed protein product [Bursaphelenchus okinawaensis]|uniref:Ribonuclease P protein subunit p29 n=1 Tax=Bursaphelenchus okinawaensis TaxID=465554 RepID=A0A811L732_9BILA|nr:unnamed protein product [Bursaphelenchus okinawaensis]CAG9119129.1 unnamed protein product [Bursaphelenchus okinawaensis]
MNMATTSKYSLGEFNVHLDRSSKKRRGKPRTDLLNVVRRRGGGKDAFKELKYNELRPMYDLWCGYFKSVLEEIHDDLDQRLVKLDYHGSILMVTSADNPSMIGLNGIVVYESKKTFQLVTRKNKLIVIPKQGSVFQFVFANKVHTIFGDAMQQQSYLREHLHRITMADILSKAHEDQQLCSKVKKFIYLYYEALDMRKEKIPYLYSSDNPQLNWNGHSVQGIDNISRFINELPVTKHDFVSVDPQPLKTAGPGWALVSVMGEVSIGGLQQSFTHVFVLNSENDSFHIKNDQYRFID